MIVPQKNQCFFELYREVRIEWFHEHLWLGKHIGQLAGYYTENPDCDLHPWYMEIFDDGTTFGDYVVELTIEMEGCFHRLSVLRGERSVVYHVDEFGLEIPYPVIDMKCHEKLTFDLYEDSTEDVSDDDENLRF
jgi:hypothetical protein